MLRLYVGYDPRESCVYHTFCESVIEHASGPVSFIPLHRPMLDDFDGERDGTNAFIFSRYLIPSLQNFVGSALFADGDMVVTDDIYELYSLRDYRKAVHVVPHDYKTKHPLKYVDTPLQNSNIDYPRKNWSSVMIWNCEHPSNKILTRDFVERASGALLHRFQWLNDDEIGHLPHEWNHLVGEDPYDEHAKLYHYTLGAPGFEHYQKCEGSRIWNRALLNALNMEGERADEMVRRAGWHRSVKERAA